MFCTIIGSAIAKPYGTPCSVYNINSKTMFRPSRLPVEESEVSIDGDSITIDGWCQLLLFKSMHRHLICYHGKFIL